MQNDEGDTFLHKAAKTSHLDFYRLAQAAPTLVPMQNNEGNTFLHIKVQENNDENDVFNICTLIQKYPYLATTPNNNGEILADLVVLKAIKRSDRLKAFAQLLSNPFTISQYLEERAYEY
jgi:ankyrin repeat protein